MSRKTGDKAHGRSHHILYDTYRGMLARCYDQTDPDYPRWGAIGVTVCDRWRAPIPVGFDNWLTDIGPRPSDERCPGTSMPLYTLDRYPERTGNYQPGNVRWATRKQQAENRKPFELTEELRTSLTERGKLANAIRWAKFSFYGS